jgi:hypothetical protein
MAKRPVEVQRDIEIQRRKVAEKLLGLRERIQSDADTTKSAIKRHSAQAGRRARQGLIVGGSAVGAAVVLGAGYSAWRRFRRQKGESILEGGEDEA